MALNDLCVCLNLNTHSFRGECRVVCVGGGGAPSHTLTLFYYKEVAALRPMAKREGHRVESPHDTHQRICLVAIYKCAALLRLSIVYLQLKDPLVTIR